MPFEKINVSQVITDSLTADPELRQMWDESRTEYQILGELVKLRKETVSQVELAEITGNKHSETDRHHKGDWFSHSVVIQYVSQGKEV